MIVYALQSLRHILGHGLVEDYYMDERVAQDHCNDNSDRSMDPERMDRTALGSY